MTKNDPLKDAMAILGMTKHESLIIAIKDIMASLVEKIRTNGGLLWVLTFI